MEKYSVGDKGDINVPWELARKGILQLGAWALELDFLHLNPGLVVYEVCNLALVLSPVKWDYTC